MAEEKLPESMTQAEIVQECNRRMGPQFGGATPTDKLDQGPNLGSPLPAIGTGARGEKL